MKRLAICLLVLGAGTPAASGEYWASGLKITGLGAVAADPSYPQYSNMVWVGLDDAAWLPEHCRKLPGLLLPDTEEALLSMARLAFEGGRTVTIKAEDDRMIGDYCRVYQITVYSGGA